MSAVTKYVTKRRFDKIREYWGSRIDEQVEEEIDGADEDDRLRLHVDTSDGLYIEDVDVFTS